MAGVVPPRPGEEMWLCLKCGKRFRPASRGGKNLMQILIIGVIAPKCPKCGSHNVHKDMTVVW